MRLCNLQLQALLRRKLLYSIAFVFDNVLSGTLWSSVDKFCCACCSIPLHMLNADNQIVALQTPPYEYALHGITMSRLIELIHPVRAASSLLFFDSPSCRPWLG